MTISTIATLIIAAPISLACTVHLLALWRNRRPRNYRYKSTREKWFARFRRRQSNDQRTWTETRRQAEFTDA